MSRSTRIRMTGVWHHVTNRGINRSRIFRGEADRQKFLEYLGKLPERFGFKVHGYVLMGNHYHLLIEDPELRISEGIHWLNVCYGMSFNRRSKRVGPVFQGRFKGVILDPQERGLSVSRYVHLNPVRVKSLGLDKGEVKAIRAGKESEAELVRERLECLKSYRWSSYRFYAGLEESPSWLTTEFVLKKTGGKAEYRKQVEKEIREGMEESPWGEMKWGLILAGEKLVCEVKKRMKGDPIEEGALRQEQKEGVKWEAIVKAVETEKGEKWKEFRDRHGDWGRNLVWILAREMGRYTLKEIGERSGSKYPAVGAGIKQMEDRMKKDKKMQKISEHLRKELNN